MQLLLGQDTVKLRKTSWILFILHYLQLTTNNVKLNQP